MSGMRGGVPLTENAEKAGSWLLSPAVVWAACLHLLTLVHRPDRFPRSCSSCCP
jgi:hypothetical protein